MVFQTRAFVRLYFLIQSKISAQPNASVFHRRSLNYPFQSVNSFCTCFQNLFHHSPRTHRTINNRQIDAPLCTSNLKGKIHRVGFFFGSKSKMRGFIPRLSRIFGRYTVKSFGVCRYGNQSGLEKRDDRE